MRATLAVLSLLLSTTGAVAEVLPEAGPKDDPHMQAVAYAPGQVFVLHLMVGRTAVLELPPEENNNQSFGSDSKFMTADIPAGTNLIFLKPVRPMAPKPFFVTATLADGHNKLYALELDVTPAAGDVVLPYRVKFVDPAAVTAANIAAWRSRQRQKVEAEAKAAMRSAVAHPVDTNPKYILQGETAADWNLLPTREVGDDGRNTHFHFPGARAVEIYVIAPDGKKSVLTVRRTARRTSPHAISWQPNGDWRMVMRTCASSTTPLMPLVRPPRATRPVRITTANCGRPDEPSQPAADFRQV